MAAQSPNVVYVFADQWRAQDTGYAGNPAVKTPNLDRLAAQSLNFTHAISGCPVCTPYRASLLTGQYWLNHGAFMNDVCLSSGAVSIAESYKAAGYDTAYIGKWHVDGHGRSSFIPRERRQGFDFWRVLECSHDYNNSFYYGDTPEKRKWEGYDAIAQTGEACGYLRGHPKEKPFLLMLSYGPPHAPLQTAPEAYRAMYRPEDMLPRGNVPPEHEEKARKDMAGYYAHMSALDDCMGKLVKTLDDAGLAENTIFVFSADHGDMLHSHGFRKKQQPYEESIRVPFLLRYPAKLGAAGRELDTLINTPDIMPTLLGLSGLKIPKTVEGDNFSRPLLKGEKPERDAALLMCPAPFGQWIRAIGGREYRGLRSPRYTYVRSLDGPWLLFDNEEDPLQQTNRVNEPALAQTQAALDALLFEKLAQTRDAFEPAQHYIEKWGYPVDKNGTVPYTR